ncbi:MAG TPA: hypothetical protein VNI83_14185 [Vicinamibacterales bacterium]|nr:hypothetical protein [Vicinamibacterales bacterium]
MPLADEIARLAADTRASASALLARAVPLLQEARRVGPAVLEETARALCRAQPSMGSLWNAAAAALDPDPGVLETFAARARRAPQAVARHVRALLGGEPAESAAPPSSSGTGRHHPASGAGQGPATSGRRLAGPGRDEPLRIVTVSSSGTVRAALLALAASRRLSVVCTESRPGGEGRDEAAVLAAAGVDVAVVPDAAVGMAVREADAVLVGADAAAADWFVNKVGTGPMAMVSTLAGTPVYVLAGSDKLVAGTLAVLLALREAAPGEVWPDAPARVCVRAPLFERVAWDHVVGLVTEAGLLAGPMVRDACEGVGRRVGADRLAELLVRADL